MYTLKPILTEQNIDLPSCMYKMNPVNTNIIENYNSSKNNSVSHRNAKNVHDMKI